MFYKWPHRNWNCWCGQENKIKIWTNACNHLIKCAHLFHWPSLCLCVVVFWYWVCRILSYQYDTYTLCVLVIICRHTYCIFVLYHMNVLQSIRMLQHISSAFDFVNMHWKQSRLYQKFGTRKTTAPYWLVMLSFDIHLYTHRILFSFLSISHCVVWCSKKKSVYVFFFLFSIKNNNRSIALFFRLKLFFVFTVVILVVTFIGVWMCA